MKLKICEILSNQEKYVNVSNDYYNPYPGYGGNFYMKVGSAFGLDASSMDWTRVDKYEYNKNPYFPLKEGKTIKYHVGDADTDNNPKFIFEITMIGE